MKTVSAARLKRLVDDLEELLEGLDDDASPEEADTDTEVVGLRDRPRESPPSQFTPPKSLAKADQAKKDKAEL